MQCDSGTKGRAGVRVALALAASIGAGALWWMTSIDAGRPDPATATPGATADDVVPASTTLARPEPANRASAGSAGSNPGSSAPTRSADASAAVPHAGATAPQAPVGPPPYLGLASRSNPILGGPDAVARFHADSPEEVRKARLEVVRSVLAQYVDGDPRDPLEFEHYQALKDELRWLQANLQP